jgi:hypothetical protein
MNPRLRVLGAWCGAAFFLLWLIGFVFFARWVPPIPPSMSANEIAHLFQTRSVPIRIAMIFMTTGAMCYLPWTALLSDLIRQIEGRSYFLTGTQFAAGVVSALTFFLPPFMWMTAAFRPERSPEITQAVVDLGWMLFIIPIAPFILQYLSLAVAIFSDSRPEPAFPRWAGYLQVWVSVSFLPAILAMFFKTGPFAWNGIFVWWIPLSFFAGWFVVMIVLARQAARRDEHTDSEPEVTKI